MNQDIYKSPESELVNEFGTGSDVASRWLRLVAAILDGLLMAPFTIGVAFWTGIFQLQMSGQPVPFIYTLLMALFGLLVFCAINGWLLIKSGQTVGKRIVGIKIVTLDGRLPVLRDHLWKRYAVYLIPGQIPVVGPIFSLVNILFIFGQQRRCLHDYAAGTKVIVA